MQRIFNIQSGLRSLVKRAARSIGIGTLKNPSWWGVGSSSSGESVSQYSSMGIGAVYACVKVISEGIAAAPFDLKRRLNTGGVQLAFDRPEYRLLRVSPRANITSFIFWQSIAVDWLLNGNSYALINRDNNGEVVELRYCKFHDVTPYEMPDGTLTYHIKGIPKRVLPEEILHFKNLGFDGLVGKSVIGLHAETIGNSLAATKMQGRQFKNGTTLGAGWFETPQGVGIEKAREVSDDINDRYAGENRFRSMVLPLAVKFHSVGVNQRDAQFIETMQYNTEDIAGIFNVPLHKIKRNTNMAKANMEQQNIEFITDTLHPIITNYCQEVDLKLFGAENLTYFTEADLSALRKGDLQTMTDHYTKLIYSGVYNVNGVREMLGKNPREGGDEYLQPTNTYNLEQLIVEIDKKKAETEKLLQQANQE